MAEFPALNLYTDAFLADTAHCDNGETGAYAALLFAAWRISDGGLPHDDRVLARLARCSTAEWRRVRAVVMAFWTQGDDGKFRQKRLEAERAKARDKSAKASASAKAKHLKNNNTGSADAERTHSEGTSERSANGVLPRPRPLPDKSTNTHTPSPEPAPSARGVTLRAITDDFRPSEADRQAVRKGRPDLSDADLERRTREFIDWNIHKANTSADWGRSWRQWMIKTREVGSAEPAAAIDWNRACEQFKRVGVWPYWAGNKPGVPGCICPPDILAKHGLQEAA